MDHLTRDIMVHHCLLLRDGKTDESWRTGQETGNGPFALRGVSYRHFVSPDTEFPTDSKPPWTVYLRVSGVNTGPARMLFLVHYRNPQGEWEYLDRREVDQTIPLPETGAETHDGLYRLPYLRLGGVGLHALSAHFWYDGVVLESEGSDGETGSVRPPWATDPEELFGTPDWVLRAVEYFWIERPA